MSPGLYLRPRCCIRLACYRRMARLAAALPLAAKLWRIGR